MPSHAVIRNSAFVTYLLSLLYDSWSFPETRFQATTWGLVVHTLFFGSSSEGARRLLHGPSFFYAHSVLAGWLQLTYVNPQIDTDDKVRRWGVTRRFGLSRTFVVHVSTVLAHWYLLRAPGGAPRGRRDTSLFEVLLRDVGPQLALLLSYKAIYHNFAVRRAMAAPGRRPRPPHPAGRPRAGRPRAEPTTATRAQETYGITRMGNDALHRWQTGVIVAMTLAVLPKWMETLRKRSLA